MSNEWQPARLAPFHHHGRYEAQAKRVRGEKVRVRVGYALESTVRTYRERGCDAEMFLEIHPDDVKRIADWLDGDIPTFICEHEILTD
jgi:hypothetical protein